MRKIDSLMPFRTAVYTGATILLLLCHSNAWSDHCTSAANVYGPHQVVTKGMLDLMGQGVFDRAVIEEFGAQQKAAMAYSDQGEYHKACNVLEALIAKHDIKSFEESYYEAHPEKRPENQDQPPAQPEAISGEAAATTTADESTSAQ